MLLACSYMAYHTYAFTGFMRNEFEGTTGWECPPGVGAADCTVDGSQVLEYYEIMDINKWVTLTILMGMALLYRTCFFFTLKWKERHTK